MAKASKQRGYGQGEPGESVFHTPVITYFTPNELPDAFKKVQGLDDHRLLSMVTAMLLEERIDKLLREFMRRYDDALAEMSFHTKLSVLEALNFIPPHLTAACRIVQKVRNSFAHDLDRTKFSDLEPKVLGLMNPLLDKVRYMVSPAKPGENALLRDFNAIAFIAITGIETYRPTFHHTLKKIAEPSFADDISKEQTIAWEQMMKEQRTKGPVAIVRDGDKWKWYYEKFVEVKDTPPPEEFKARVTNTSAKTSGP